MVKNKYKSMASKGLAFLEDAVLEVLRRSNKPLFPKDIANRLNFYGAEDPMGRIATNAIIQGVLMCLLKSGDVKREGVDGRKGWYGW